METVGSRLKHYREETGLSQRALAKLIGMTGQWVSDVEKGEIVSPGIEAVTAIDVALSELLGRSVSISLRPPGHPEKPIDLPPPRTLREAAERLYTLARQAGEVVWVRPAGAVSAGGGAPEQALIPYLPRPEERGHDFVWLEVVGTCMEPRIHAGHVVIVDTSASPRPGDIVLAEHDGDYLVKLLASVNGHLELRALQGQEPVQVTETTHILGVVVVVQHPP